MIYSIRCEIEILLFRAVSCKSIEQREGSNINFMRVIWGDKKLGHVKRVYLFKWLSRISVLDSSHLLLKYLYKWNETRNKNEYIPWIFNSITLFIVYFILSIVLFLNFQFIPKLLYHQIIFSIYIFSHLSLIFFLRLFVCYLYIPHILIFGVLYFWLILPS